jgi:HEAT repeat protein
MNRRTFLQASLAGAVLQPATAAAPPTKLEQAWQTLSELNQSKNILHREYALAGYAFLAQHSSRALKMTSDVLANDSDSQVRAFTAAALGKEKCRAAATALKKALIDRSPGVAFAAAKSLWDMNDHAGAVVFQEVLTGTRKGSQGIVPGYVEDAKHKVHDPKALTVLGVNEVVGSLFGPAGMALSFAEQNLKDKGAAGRAVAAGALATDRSPDATKALESALDDSSPIVRGAACRALAILGYRTAIPLVEPLLDEKNEASRSMASAAYIRLHARYAPEKGSSQSSKS